MSSLSQLNEIQTHDYPLDSWQHIEKYTGIFFIVSAVLLGGLIFSWKIFPIFLAIALCVTTYKYIRTKNEEASDVIFILLIAATAYAVVFATGWLLYSNGISISALAIVYLSGMLITALLTVP
jgi:hypothetical protein